MKLHEWQDAKGNKINFNSASSNINNSSSGSFKKRFEKLIKYYGQHLPAEIDYITVNLLSKDTIDFTEFHTDKSSVTFNIYLGPTTEAWRLKIFYNGNLTDDLAGQGWVELLKTLRPYITVPVVSTPEYKNLLTEWVDKTGNKVSLSYQSSTASFGGYKSKFEKLIKYHLDHCSSELEGVNRKDIRAYGFHLGEHYYTGRNEFDRDLTVTVDKDTDIFYFNVFVDGREVNKAQAKGWDKFLELLYAYMKLPEAGTQEYSDLLEWVDSKGNKITNNSHNCSSSTKPASSKTNKEKFTELTDYMIKHKGLIASKAEVVRLDDGGFTYKEYWKSPMGQDYVLTLLVGYSRFNSSWRYELYIDTKVVKEVQGSGWEELLEELEKYFYVPKAGSKEYKDLCESISIAEDFKLYENLWENI